MPTFTHPSTRAHSQANMAHRQTCGKYDINVSKVQVNKLCLHGLPRPYTGNYDSKPDTGSSLRTSEAISCERHNSGESELTLR